MTAPTQFTARAAKLTLVLDPAQLTGIEVLNGAGPQAFMIAVGSRRLAGKFNAKSLRRAVAAVNEHGPDKVAVVVQGPLGDANTIEEAGIAAQLKGAR